MALKREKVAAAVAVFYQALSGASMQSHKLWHRVLAKAESGERRDRKLREVWVDLPTGVYSPSMDNPELRSGVPIPEFLGGTPSGR